MQLRKALFLASFLAITGCEPDEDKPIDVTPTDETKAAISLECAQCRDGAFRIAEGVSGGVIIQASLAKAPTSDVVIVAESSDKTELTVDPPEATITAENWKTAKVSFALTGIEDSLNDGDQSVRVSFRAKSDDEAYAALEPQTISGIVTDSRKTSQTCIVQCRDPQTLIACPEGAAGASKDIACPEGCEDGACIETEKCEASECADSETLTYCNPETGIFEDINCPYGCEDGACIKKCEASECADSETLTYCDPKTGIFEDINCPYGCKYGACAEKCSESVCADKMTLSVCDAESGIARDRNCEYGCSAGRCLEQGEKPVVVRFMAANVTSGNHQTYDDGKGIRIIQAFSPDIILMQEFNYTDGESALVEKVCGKDCHYTTSPHSIPNAIISKYPIIESGYWQSNLGTSRNWDWAVIDLPGDRDLLAVSVHLHSSNNSKEMSPLKEKIAAKQKEGNYYVVLGGDFNTNARGTVRSSFGSILYVGKENSAAKDDETMTPPLDKVCDGGEFPVDQQGNSCTSGERDDPYDWVLFDKTLDTYEIPITVGSHTYPNGHIIDSRIYAQLGELDDVPPITEIDSWLCVDSAWCPNNKGTRTNMQHQAVIRDVELHVK